MSDGRAERWCRLVLVDGLVCTSLGMLGVRHSTIIFSSGGVALGRTDIMIQSVKTAVIQVESEILCCIVHIYPLNLMTR